jgi:hypothetical protein
MGGGGEQHFKMQMYVMCSRAREHLEVILMQTPPRDGLMPSADLYQREDLA